MAATLNAIGKSCPLPLEETKIAVEKIEVGTELTINFDCVQATENIPRWAAAEGHEITNFEATDDGVWTISLKKGA
ncbi:MAG: sulfurtransferase TusA family protein [Turicibacter sp.]|nr:sulfurtransferase TusA family protein [Turicibacter sp.]